MHCLLKKKKIKMYTKHKQLKQKLTGTIKNNCIESDFMMADEEGA